MFSEVERNHIENKEKSISNEIEKPEINFVLCVGMFLQLKPD
jgi:hypothetical protein